MSKTGFKGAFGARHFDLAARHFAARGRLASSLQGCILSSLRAAYELPQAACERLASSLRAAYEQPTSSLRGCIPNTLRAPYEPARLPAAQQLASPSARPSAACEATRAQFARTLEPLKFLELLPLGPRIDTVSEYRILAYVSNLGL